MYRELQPLRQALSAELKADLPPAGPGIDTEHLLQTYLDRLTMYVGCDVADQTFTLLSADAAGEELGHRLDVLNNLSGFEQAWKWLEGLRGQHNLRIILLAMESSGIYYWGWWDFLAGRPNLARVLYNPRTTEHMTEVLSKRVRNELVDAYALSEQVRLGSTPEVVLTEDADLLTARLCSRAARDLAQQINRKKNQLRSLIRAYNPAFTQVFPGAKFHHPAAYALLQRHVLPDEFTTARTPAITAILQDHCRTIFGQDEAERLTALCRQTLTSQTFARQIGREVLHQRVLQLTQDVLAAHKHQQRFLKTGYSLIEKRPQTTLLRTVKGAGISNTLALVSEVGDFERFPDGQHIASFLGLTTSKHISGTTLFRSKHITKQGSPNGRYAAVNIALHLSQRVPKYQQMYQRLKLRKPPRKGHFIALVAIARDFVTNVLYDMWRYQRPFFLEVQDYREYLRTHPRSDD
ncbi:MAG: transposase [Anaerolineae bacterium]|jgi:transposase